MTALTGPDLDQGPVTEPDTEPAGDEPETPTLEPGALEPNQDEADGDA